MSRVTISDVAKTLAAIDAEVQRLDLEIEQDAIRIQVMQEARAAKAETVRNLLRKAKAIAVNFTRSGK